MTYSEDFDERATTWDSDPERVARALAVAEGIRSRVTLSSSMRALEYGCGTGLLSFGLREYLGHVTLADRSPGMLAVLNEKIRESGATNMLPVSLDLLKEPIPDTKYDLIYTLMTLHHIDDTDGILRALSAMLTSPGVLCVADLDAEDGSFHGPGFTGHNGFDRDDLGRRAIAAGLNAVQFSTVYHMTSREKVGQIDFPLFLMVAEK